MYEKKVCVCAWIERGKRQGIFFVMSHLYSSAMLANKGVSCPLQRKPCPELEATFFSQITWWWLNRYVCIHGYVHSRPIIHFVF